MNRKVFNLPMRVRLNTPHKIRLYVQPDHRCNCYRWVRKPFVDNANKAIEKAKMKPADNIVTAINQNNTQNGSIADELIKMKSLFDDGIITQDEFDSLKSKLIQ